MDKSIQHYNQSNIDEIKSQTIKAMNSDFESKFRDLIKNDYSWEVTANQTLDAYKKVLNE